MNTKTQTTQYARGYSDGLEGKRCRDNASQYYLKGYHAGMWLRFEDMTKDQD